MHDLVRRLRALAQPDGCLHVFTTRDGNPYTRTPTGFASTWQRAMAKVLEVKVIPHRFTPRPSGLLHDPAQGAVWGPAGVARRHEDDRKYL
ncbi:hypothetical protein QTI17_13625 [Variovorax sp. J31P179]|uniref:hypothetical protein n=1 Tax=Variovorax sp. J31P179 TaxID=3053508 RepID=UPI002576E7C5|nr:hypothetical protein [Variovorax sp. J31P179]MDM0081638.1 hypothetical protein [Variovorax sp. J31P179]